MNFKTEFIIYVVALFVFSLVLGFFGIRELVQGDERRAVVPLLGSLFCLLIPYLMVHVLTKKEDSDDDASKPGS